MAANGLHRELDNSSEDSETPEQENVNAALNVPRLSRPIRWPKRKAEKVYMMVHIIETSRKQGNNGK
jgi:hypothetical protein